MTSFVLLCAALLAAVALWITLPLFRSKTDDDGAGTRKERRTTALAVIVVVSVGATVLYPLLSKWDWDAATRAANQEAQFEDLLKQLEARLVAAPNDVEGWLLLGRSTLKLGRMPRATEAYQRAYDLTRGENVEAILGLGETLALTDESSLTGRAGQLFDEALVKAPNHPKALWYGSMAALQSGDLRKGRDRLQLLMAQNPPEELRGILERQIQDLNQQIGEAGQGSATATAPGASIEGRQIRVAVTIAPQIKAKLGNTLALFVLAREPSGGPPLAVQRHTSDQIPLTVELTEKDAMIATRNIASVPRVQVVARLSQSGTPQAQSGDFFGQADYEFGSDAGTLNILIDKTVP